MSRRSEKSEFVLGVFASARAISAVLLERRGEKIKIADQFLHHRIHERDLEHATTMAAGGRTLKSGSETDYMLEIGGASEGSALTRSELEYFGSTTDSESKAPGTPVQPPSPAFMPQMSELLRKMEAEDRSTFRIAFVVSPPDVSYEEIQSTRKDPRSGAPTGSSNRHGGLSRSQLKKRYYQETGRQIDDRIGFVSVGGRGNQQRHVAILANPREPVNLTLESLGRRGVTIPPIDFLDSEFSSFVALARRSRTTTSTNKTALVRVGAEETLLLFFSGKELLHYERLRSVTTYDAPETVSSRVMLQLDEQKIGELDNILIATEGDERPLIDGFQRAFSESIIESVTETLSDLHLELPEESDLSYEALLAATTALRSMQRWDDDEFEPHVNLLPKRTKYRKERLAITWHTIAMMAILFGLTFWFVSRYMANENRIRERRTELLVNPPAPPLTDPELLQVRVDSLQTAYVQYTRSLHVLDSILVGSDRWSRFLEDVTQSTGRLSGIWLTRWDADGNSVTMTGTARSRSTVARFARLLDGSVERLASENVQHEDQEVRVYHFTLSTPVPATMPEVARYLQEQLLADETDNTRDGGAPRPASNTASPQ